MVSFLFQSAGWRVYCRKRFLVGTIDLWIVLTEDFIKVDQIVHSK